MNTVAMCFCWHLAPYAMAPAPSGIVGIAPSRDPHGLGEAFPKLQPLTILHVRGDKSQNPIPPEFFQPGGAKPTVVSLLSTGGASVSSVGNERTQRAVHALVVWAGSLSIRA